MNRLVLIGNGFDLAHGMKTRYSDFISWYIKSAFEKARISQVFEDSFIKIRTLHFFTAQRSADNVDLNYFLNCFVDKGTYERYLEASQHGFTTDSGFAAIFKKRFIKHLVTTCMNCGWVNIEAEYYDELKLILNDDNRDARVKDLNDTLSFLITQFSRYLGSLEIPKIIPAYQDLFEEKINSNDIWSNRSLNDYPSRKILLVIFNYTGLMERYLQASDYYVSLINIHGQLNDEENRIIFGFGDEMDKDYPTIEQQGNKQFMRFFKSFGYHLTTNYHQLIRFIDSQDFQVYILGHSCGLSDRTMLNMIFEHANCKSIKIFYHKTGDNDNYTDLTMEISRHFHNKAMFRRLVVNKPSSSPMPQAPNNHS